MIQKLKGALIRATGVAAVGLGLVGLGAHFLKASVDSDAAYTSTMSGTVPGGLRSLPRDPAVPPLPTAALHAPPKATVHRPVRRPTFTPEAVTTDCSVLFDAVPQAGALAQLTLRAPCHGGASATVRHETLRFDATVSADGTLSMVVPGLAADATFEAMLDGQTYRTSTTLNDMSDYARVVVQGADIGDVHIHALEYGAVHGGMGHVWRDAPGSAERAIRVRGGFLVRLGDAGRPGAQTAEVYTFPAGLSQRSGAVRLSIETTITDLNRDRFVAAEVLQPGLVGSMLSTTLSLDMPECTGIGDILVLKNILRDMKIASN